MKFWLDSVGMASGATCSPFDFLREEFQIFRSGFRNICFWEASLSCLHLNFWSWWPPSAPRDLSLSRGHLVLTRTRLTGPRSGHFKMEILQASNFEIFSLALAGRGLSNHWHTGMLWKSVPASKIVGKLHNSSAETGFLVSGVFLGNQNVFNFLGLDDLEYRLEDRDPQPLANKTLAKLPTAQRLCYSSINLLFPKGSEAVLLVKFLMWS